ncbi:MAG: phosphomannomutase/phosphoglucomutase [Chromatiaceae bacterium]|nr:phosphomannomutase/phosphoglucomutase [Chromatiaceae bacterium]
MGLINRNVDQAASQAGGGKGGRALIVYLLPTLLVGIALMVVVALFAQQAIQSGASRSARATAQSVSEAVAARLAGAVTARRDLLALVLSEGRAAAALSSGDPSAIKAEEAVIQQRVAGLLQVRLLPRDASQPDPAGAAPLGYAGLDLLRRTVDSGRPSAAEIHQIKSGAPYLAMALPVNVAGGNAGVLFAAWDMRFLVGLLEQSPAFQGRLQLVQGGDGGYVLAKGPGGQDGPLTEGAVEVPDSIWKVSYGTDPDTGGMGGLLTMASVVAAGGLALLLSVFLQWRALARDLRADMGTLVNLGEAILRRENGAARQAQVASTRDAIALLSQYARESREMPATAAAPAVRRAVPMAGLPESRTQGMEVEELDSDPAELLAARPRKAPKIDIPDTLFRAYDVRGVVGQALTGPFAELLGQAVATLVQEQGGHRVAVARDARPSSPQLAEALVRGLNAGGCDVLDIGQAPTPLLYFAMHTQPVQAGVVVTGSHNPADYNGFKIVIGDRVLDGDELLALRRRMLEGVFSQGNGSIERIDLVAEYVEAVVREVQLARPLKVVVDAGNGVAGDLAVATLEALGCEVVPLFCEPDGSFPNHHPDPSQPDNLASLMLEVQAQDADIGIALDGDGDRLGVIDNTGANVWPDSILMLLAADILGRHPGVDILYDVKSSRHLASFILGHGGRPIMWKSGHSRMRAKMLETGALLGGEFSGHLFIKERWFGFDDAVYAAVRVLELLALEPRGASELFAELPSSPSTPEYHLMLEEGQSRELMRALDAHKVFDDARLVELDGLRVEFGSGWGLIRPSNTTPSLTFRFEADDERSLEEIKSRFRDLLRRVAPDMQAPF